ncbi:MAG: hypothetical protein QM780_04965 [Hyphomicrobium sp.]|uniref:hypothetical protein n=1 Tax=Hyphomicrobium sp. TaxID=82 RepID=UPI0039E3DB04
MRNLFLAAALALGIGFIASDAQAATVSGNIAAVQTAAQSGNGLVEKTHYRRGYYYRHGYYGYRPYWHRGYYRRHHWRPRPFGYRTYYRPRYYGYYR